MGGSFFLVAVALSVFASALCRPRAVAKVAPPPARAAFSADLSRTVVRLSADERRRWNARALWKKGYGLRAAGFRVE
jgi:hypothetical protein